MIDKALGLANPDPVETYSNSPHLHAELNIPTDATGSIGKATRSTESRDRPKRESREGDKRDGDRPARSRDRSRQRTRGGSTGTGHVEGTEASSVDKAPVDAEGAPAGDDTGPAKRRRRRRRPNSNSAAPAAG